MKRKKNLSFRVLCPISFSLILTVSSPVWAGSYQWDTNGNSAGLGGTGNWADANWDDTASGANDGTETPVLHTFTTADTALFGGSAGTVTVAPGTAAGTLKFTTGGYTLSGGSIALDTAAWAWGTYSTHDIIIGGGNTVTINSNLSNTSGNGVYISSGISGAGTGSGGVNGGTVVLGGTNTFGRELYVCGSTLEIGSFSALGFSGSYGLSLRNWEIGSSGVSTFRYTGATTTFSNNSSNGGGWLIGAGKFVFDVTQSGTALTLDRNIVSNNNVANTLEKTGAGTLALTGANTYSNNAASTTGGTIITAGTLAFGNGSLGSTGAITMNGGALRWNGTNTQDISSRLTLVAGKTATFDTNGNPVAFSSAIGGGTSAAVTKAGAGTLTLSGNNTYTGATAVNAGTLRLAGTNTSAITVGGSATLSVTPAAVTTGLLVMNAGSTLAVDASITGAFTSAGVVFAGGSKLVFNSGLTAGNTYLVLNYGAAGATNPGNLTTLARGTLTNDTANNRLTFLAGGVGDRTWNTASGTWDVMTTANFLEGDQMFNAGDTVVFGNPASAANVTLAGSLVPASVSVANTNNYTFSGSGSIAGTSTLTKNGTGTLSMSTVNSYTGATTISGGTLEISGAGQLGGGTYAGAVTNDASLKINSTASQTFSGVIGGTGTLVKSNSGMLVLSNANTYAGGTTIDGGSVTLGNAAGLGTGAVTVGNGANLTIGANTVGNPVTLGPGGGNLAGGAGDYGIFTGKVSGGTAGTDSLVINTGHVELRNPANDFSGNVNLGGAYYLRTTVSETIPDTAVIGFANSSAGFKIFSTTAGTITETVAGINSSVGGYGVFAEGAGQPVVANLRVGHGNVSSSYNGPIWQYGTGTLNLEKIGGGTLALSGTNTYTGATTVTGGTLRVSGGAAIPDASAVSIADVAGATLTLGANETIASLAGGGAAGGSVNLQANTLTIGGNASTTFAGIISGDGALTKAGTGTLTLSGSNTYTGATAVSAGTLYLSGSLVGSVEIGADAAITGGGVIGGTLTFDSGANLDLTGATIPVNGTSTGILRVASGRTITLANFNFTDIAGWDYVNAEPGVYTLISGGGSVGFGGSTPNSIETAYDFGNGRKGYFRQGSLQAVVIPEPGAVLLGGLGMLALLRRRRSC